MVTQKLPVMVRVGCKIDLDPWNSRNGGFNLSNRSVYHIMYLTTSGGLSTYWNFTVYSIQYIQVVSYVDEEVCCSKQGRHFFISCNSS